MKLTPLPPYFLVKLPRKKRDSGGRIIIPDTIKHMAYNLQCGEIVGIGTKAAEYFPEAKIGMTLIFHHFVEDENEQAARVDHLIYQEDDYNYYVVTAFECYGKNVETYGVWDGENIIPNKDYIFLHLPEKQKSDIDLDSLEKEIGFKPDIPMEVSSGGLLVFKGWEDSRERKEEKQAELKKEVEELSKSGNHKLSTKQGVLQREWEMEAISRDINKKSYIPFKPAFYNDVLMTHFEHKDKIDEDDFIYVLNMAAATTLKFKETEYIVARTKYIACISKGTVDSIHVYGGE